MRTIRQDMIEALGRGLAAAGPEKDKMLGYLGSLQNPDGGFRGRSTASDLYYSVFATEPLLTAGGGCDRSALAGYLKTIDTSRLDFIHLCCLIRLMGNLNLLDEVMTTRLRERLDSFRCADGFFHHAEPAARGSVYGAFMAMGAYQELYCTSGFGRLETFVNSFQNEDGSFGNDAQTAMGMVPATAAAMVMLRQAGCAVNPASVQWLLSCMTDDGGMAVSPVMPVADLLSTSTALHSLRLAGVDLDPIREATLRFVTSCLTDSGGFQAHAFDPSVDSEYTFYGILALGNLGE
ncbi:MAG: prenyltransferase/squalene oxidase repeat-containing protein [Anaerohalosphaeraceae bacterium]